MRLFTVFSGHRRLPPDERERVLTLREAAAAMRAEHGVEGAGRAAIVIKPTPGDEFRAIVADAERVVRSRGAQCGMVVETRADDHGFDWLVFSGPEFEELLAGTHVVARALIDHGHGERLLCGVFAFMEPDGAEHYWIYSGERGTFHPFVPRPGAARRRDARHEQELVRRMAGRLPVEGDHARWFALWGTPI